MTANVTAVTAMAIVCARTWRIVNPLSPLWHCDATPIAVRLLVLSLVASPPGCGEPIAFLVLQGNRYPATYQRRDATVAAQGANCPRHEGW
jgi:hypothetical protein